MSFLGRDLARRLGIWALIQALPGEALLRSYLRRAYFGLAGVIIGSVLTGGALAAALVFAYRLLLQRGWPAGEVLGLTAAVGIAVILGCFYMAGRWFTELASIRQEAGVFSDVGRDVLSGVFNTLLEGFLEGMTTAKEVRERQEAWRKAKRKKSTRYKENT